MLLQFARIPAARPLAIVSVVAALTVACGSDAPTDSSARDDSAEQEETRAKSDASSASSARGDAGRAMAGTKPDSGASSNQQEPDGEDLPDAAPASRDAGADAARPSTADSGGADAAAQSGSDASASPDAAPSSDTNIPMTIPPASNGAGEIRPSTTVLKSARNGGKDVWDFENKKIGVSSSIECEGSEGQPTVFELEDGVTVKNLIVAGGRAGGNGIVCKGNCTLDHVYWEDVCEDAATNSKDGATMTLDHVIALNATDKVFQHNSKGGSRTIIRNSYISGFGKLWRSCGDCENNGGPRHLEIDNVRVDGIKTCVAGANRNYGDTVSVKNLYVKGGYDASQDKPKICQEYIGVTDHQGESTKVDNGKSQWSTTTCKLRTADVKAY